MEISSINTQCTATTFIHWLPSTTNFPEAKLSSTFLSPKFWKYSKTLQQQPENIQRLFCLQICLSRKSATTWKYSKTFRAINNSSQHQQPAAAINSSNQHQQPAAAINSSNQHQQPAAAINSSSNQQQQPAAATNTSNQQQQSTAAINSSNQLPSYQHHFRNPRRPTLYNITVPSTGYVLLEVDLGLAARLRVQSPLPRTTFVTFRFF